MTAATPPRDEHGHQWGETFTRAQFTLVCTRCLIRDDRPGANQPCDALLERDMSIAEIEARPAELGWPEQPEEATDA